MVNIEFDHAKATEKQLVYNEIYPPIIEKKKFLIHVKSRSISCLNRILQQKRKSTILQSNQKSTRNFGQKKISTYVFRATSFFH